MNPQAQGEPQGTAQSVPIGVPQDLPDTYVWKAPGKAAAVHIPLTVIDRLSAEIMRSYGANPKRNAEIGGVLIGSVEQGPPAIVRIEDFEVVPCQHLRGPSYVFTEEDCGPFERAGTRPDAIGLFRSHTREGLSLAIEDVELLDHFFDFENAVALLVRPYATKAGVAGFFTRENETFPEAAPLEFPFRRQELSGEDRPPRRSIMERQRRSALHPGLSQNAAQGADRRADGDAAGDADRDVDRNVDRDSGPAAELPSPSVPAGNGRASERNLQTTPRNLPPFLPASPRQAPISESHPPPSAGYSQSLDPLAEPAYDAAIPARSHMRTSWVWIPLSFLFLLFGIALGYQVALLNVGSRSSNPAAEFSLSLAVSKTGQNLSVHWDRQAPAVRASQRGVLEIEEAGVTKPVDLDAAQLRNGTLTYSNATNDVHFKLTVFPKDQVRVTESAEWRQ